MRCLGAPVGFIIAAPANAHAHALTKRHKLEVKAKNHASVDAFPAAGVTDFGTSEDAPSNQPNSPGEPDGAYLRDPDRNRASTFAPNSDTTVELDVGSFSIRGARLVVFATENASARVNVVLLAACDS